MFDAGINLLTGINAFTDKYPHHFLIKLHSYTDTADSELDELESTRCMTVQERNLKEKKNGS